jgi:phage-related minor tail protein
VVVCVHDVERLPAAGEQEMVKEFLAYIDEITEFGKVSISAEKLFDMFVAKKNLSDNHAYGFRLRLERKGIL